MGLEFLYTQPVRIRFGSGKFAGIGSILSELGLRRCAAVCDPFLRPRLDALREKLPALCVVYSDVQPNPQLSGAAAVAALIRETVADCVIGVGGGSTLDTAKFAAAIAWGSGSPDDYFDGRLPFPTDHIPVVTVPTTAGTGSEVTQVSVMSRGPEKKTINAGGPGGLLQRKRLSAQR